MNLIILTEKDKIDNDWYHLDDNRAEHVKTVLKLSTGDMIEIGLLNGPVGKAMVAEVTPQGIILKISDLKESQPILPTVDLICALPRPQTLKKVLITSAMMGVRKLHLVRANRVEKSYFQTPLLKPEKYMPFLLEGLSQGKLTRLPEVIVYDRFKFFFEDTLTAIEKGASVKPMKLIADPEASVDLGKWYKKDTGWYIFAVGPEGGWVPFELELMEKAGFQKFTLGRRLLRVEHAVTATLAQLELLVR